MHDETKGNPFYSNFWALLSSAFLLFSCNVNSSNQDVVDRVFLGLLTGNVPDTTEIYRKFDGSLSASNKCTIASLLCLYGGSSSGYCKCESDTAIARLAEVQRHISSLDYGNAFESLRSFPLEKEGDPVAILMYCRLLAHCMDQRAVDITPGYVEIALQRLDATHWSNTIFAQYAEMLKLYMESVLIFSKNAYTEALIPAFAGLALHENSLRHIEFPALKYDFLYLIGKIYSHDSEFRLATHYFKTISASPYPTQTTDYEIVKINLFLLADLQGHTALRDSLFKSIPDSSQTAPFGFQYSKNFIYGYSHFLHQQPAQARQYYLQAAAIFDSTDQCNSILLSLYNYIAESYLQEARIDSALYYNRLALTPVCGQLQKYREQIWHMLYTKTQIAYSLCQAHLNTFSCSEASKTFYDQQIFLDTMFDITDPHFSDATVYNLEAYLEHLLRIDALYVPDSIYFEAAAIMELSKSRSLIRGLHGASRDQFIVTNPEYRKCSQKLSELLKTTNNLRELRPVDDTIYLSLFRYFEQKRQIEKQLSIPESKTLRSTTARNTKQEIQEYCSQYHTQIFQFLGTENSYYAVYINPDTAAFYNISKVLVDSCLREWRSSLHPQDSLGSQTISALHTLYQILLRDHVDKNMRNIVVLPDLQLNGFPFEVLIHHSGDVTQYLIENHSVSYHFSIASLIKEQPTSIQVQSVSIVSWSNPKTIGKNLTEYPELPGGYSECLRFCQLLGEKCAFLSGDQLTVDNFERNLTSDILHLSTHAFSSDINRLDNYFLLRNRDEAIKYYAYNLPSTENHLSHVVLSACESGTGMYLPGDGVYSISREFLRAGSECVTKTLWPIPDLKTASLFAIYYDELKKGSTVTEAIRTAKMEYLREANAYDHPYVWAGIIVEGNPFMSFQF